MNARDSAKNECAVERVGRALRDAYEPIVSEPVPLALEDLARRLEETGDKKGEGSQLASLPRQVPWRQLARLLKVQRRDWRSLGWIIPTAAAIGFVAGQIVRRLA